MWGALRRPFHRWCGWLKASPFPSSIWAAVLTFRTRTRWTCPGRRRVARRRKSLEHMARALRDTWRAAADRAGSERPIALARLASDLWDVAKDEDWVLVNRSLRGWTRRLWDWTTTKPYVGAHMGGGVGYGIGHSVGAALALGKTPLGLDIQPDGDLLYTPSALWTAAHHRIPLLIWL